MSAGDPSRPTDGLADLFERLSEVAFRCGRAEETRLGEMEAQAREALASLDALFEETHFGANEEMGIGALVAKAKAEAERSMPGDTAEPYATYAEFVEDWVGDWTESCFSWVRCRARDYPVCDHPKCDALGEVSGWNCVSVQGGFWLAPSIAGVEHRPRFCGECLARRWDVDNFREWASQIERGVLAGLQP
jgi:hypothetical protein